MIKIVILNSLRDKIYKIFKQDSLKVYKKIKQLKTNPHKGKILTNVNDITLRELKYGSFKLYYIIDKNKLSLFNEEKLKELLIKFIAISKKNNQKRTINEIKNVLRNIGDEGFE